MHPNHLNPEFLRSYARSGFIDGIHVSPPADDISAKGYIAVVRLKDGSAYKLMTHDRHVRRFRSLDSVRSSMMRVGIQDWTFSEVPTDDHR